MKIYEQTTPVALHRLLARLLDDHQRMEPHHADLCRLCQDTMRTLDLLAEEVPDGTDDCPGCCAPKGEAHSNSCPAAVGNCPGCAVEPGHRHLPYCPVGPSSTVFPLRLGVGSSSRTGFYCPDCFAKAGELHADACPEANGATRTGKPPIPLGVSASVGDDGHTKFGYPGQPAQVEQKGEQPGGAWSGSYGMSTGSEIPVVYDASGRMKYHPDYHGKQRTPWTTNDEKYLIENYETAGPEQVSLALERTINTVMGRACELRKAGRLLKPVKKTYTKRTRSAAILEAA